MSYAYGSSFRDRSRETIDAEENDTPQDIEELIEGCKRSRVSDYDQAEIDEFTKAMRKHLKLEDSSDLTLLAKCFMKLNVKKAKNNKSSHDNDDKEPSTTRPSLFKTSSSSSTSSTSSSESKENRETNQTKATTTKTAATDKNNNIANGRRYVKVTRKTNDKPQKGFAFPSSFPSNTSSTSQVPFQPNIEFHNKINEEEKKKKKQEQEAANNNNNNRSGVGFTFNPSSTTTTSKQPTPYDQNNNVNKTSGGFTFNSSKTTSTSKIPSVSINDPPKTPAAAAATPKASIPGSTPDTTGTFNTPSSFNFASDDNEDGEEATPPAPPEFNSFYGTMGSPAFNLGKSSATKKNGKSTARRRTKRGITTTPAIPTTTNVNNVPTSAAPAPAEVRFAQEQATTTPFRPQSLFDQKQPSAMKYTPYATTPHATKDAATPYTAASAMNFTPYSVAMGESPMSVAPMSVEQPKFNIGSSFKTPGRRNSLKSPRKGRTSTTRGGAGNFYPTQQANDNNPPQPEEKKATEAPAAAETTTTRDNSGLKEMVENHRKVAAEYYKAGKYKEAIMGYTNLLDRYTLRDNTRAVLLANRAAALLMLGAYHSAGCDCHDAIESLPDEGSRVSSGNLFTEGGPFLISKVYTRMGRAAVKLGQTEEGLKSYNAAISVAKNAIQVSQLPSDDSNLTYLQQIINDAEAGSSEIRRLRGEITAIKSMGLNCTLDVQKKTRRENQSALAHMNEALEIAPGSSELQEMKVAVLAFLHRWRELYLYCETIAANTVKFDGIFMHDLLLKNPLPNVEVAKHLEADTFDKNHKDIKLSPEAVAEAILRIPAELQQAYLQALKMEEKFPQAQAAVTSLSNFVVTYKYNEVANFLWLEAEGKKINQLKGKKKAGDEFFVNGDYDGAVKKYTECLAMDSGGINGGRLNAVLHCNRAAAYMAISKYKNAISDCSAALKIHPHYMKAMLRRCRCYGRLNRYEEAITGYEQYRKLAEQAKKPGQVYTDLACNFDLPKDVKDRDLKAVREELAEIKEAKAKAEKSAKQNEAENERRKQWYNSSFGNNNNSSKFGNNGGAGGSSKKKNTPNSDAHRRRQEWYNQQNDGSRRWDSFHGRRPNQNKQRAKSTPRPGFTRNDRKEESWRSESARSPYDGVSNSKCHYQLLGVSKNANEAAIKKAYHKAALKYHPDKNKDAGASDMFRKVKQAYDVLKDPAKKREYDYQNSRYATYP